MSELYDAVVELKYDMVRAGYDAWIMDLIDMMEYKRYDEVVAEMKSMIASNKARMERNGRPLKLLAKKCLFCSSTTCYCT